MKTITEFKGEYRCLSNFWPTKVELHELTYSTVEHAFQAAKTIDTRERRIIWSQSTPGQAKRAGRNVTLRKDWEDVKISIMENLVRQKFSNDEYFREKLLSTGDTILIEGNTWGDKFWGKTFPDMEGENHLGKILMKIRDDSCTVKGS